MKEKINCKYGYCAKVSTGQNEANKPKRCGVVGEGEPNPNRGKISRAPVSTPGSSARDKTWRIETGVQGGDI